MLLRKIAGAAAAGALAVGTLATMAGPAQAATSDATFSCVVPMFGRTFDWSTQVTVTADRKDGSAAELTATTGALTGFTIPLAVTDMAVDGSMAVTAGGESATLTGSDTVASLAVGDPIPTPALTGAIAASGTSVDVAVNSLDFVANAMGVKVDVNCATVGDVVVTGVEIPAPAPAQAKTKSTTKVKFNAKKKQATITTAVKAGKKNAAGKVRIEVKRGKKVVVKKTVKLKKGQAKLVVKKGKLKQKGVYKINASYLGNKKFAKSASKAKFRVKK